jgi:hypothetical protein
VALVFIIFMVSSSTNFAFSSLFCLSKATVWPSSHHFSSGRRDDGDGAGVSHFMLAFPLSPVSVISGLLARSQSTVCAVPHWKHTGRPSLQCLAGGGHIPTGTLIACLIVSFGGLAAAFATSSFRARLRASFSDLSPSTRRCCSVLCLSLWW